MTELQLEFEKHGHELIFTPPYRCEFQPSELLWRHGKNHAARGWYSARSLGQTYDDLCSGFYGGSVGKASDVQVNGATGEMCASWVATCELEMDEWVEKKSTRLSGGVTDLTDKGADSYGDDSDSDDDGGDDADAEDTDSPSEEED